jgi:hypothetical protein
VISALLRGYGRRAANVGALILEMQAWEQVAPQEYVSETNSLMLSVVAIT